MDLLRFAALEQVLESVWDLPQVKAQLGETDSSDDVSGFKDLLCARRAKGNQYLTKNKTDGIEDDDDDDGEAGDDTSGVAGGEAERPVTSLSPPPYSTSLFFFSL